MKMELSRELLKDANIPERFWALDFQSYFGQPTAQSLLTAYVKNFRTALINGTGISLYGPPQSCKTFLGTFILKCLLIRGYQVRYTTVPDLAREHFGDRDQHFSLRQLYSTTQCIMVDDVLPNPHKGEVSALERLFQIIAGNNSCCILGTTLTLNELGEHYGESAARYVGHLRQIDTAYDGTAFALDSKQDAAKRSIWKD